MESSTKKNEKADAKQRKKSAKADLKRTKKGGMAGTGRAGDSPAVRFAESIRGVLSVLLGASLIVALFLGHRGAIISLDDVIDSLFAARAGKIVLALIGLALLIYGLKILRVMR